MYSCRIQSCTILPGLEPLNDKPLRILAKKKKKKLLKLQNRYRIKKDVKKKKNG